MLDYAVKLTRTPYEIDYATKLTVTPWEMRVGDVESLRRAGFEDAAILDINQVTGYYAFANRLVDGLGVDLENFWGDQGHTP